MARNSDDTRSLSVTMPAPLYEEVEAIARVEHRSKSEVVREALRHYQFTRNWRVIREWGVETAQRLNLSNPEDLEPFLG